MQVIYSPGFRKAYKKLHANQLPEMDAAIQAVKKNPYSGEQKKGDLNYLHVYKFKMVRQLILIGYEITEDKELILAFLDFGTHENFYRDIKKQ
jgi:mRNA-degrading endonuclease RelE of RelBE toxin-antitoxin system